MSERASHLIMTLSADGEIDVFGGYGSELAAQGVYDKLAALLKATGVRMKLIAVPELDGMAAAAAQPAAAMPVVPLMSSEPPAKFVRPKSQSEFELETKAKMNGEIPMDGIQWRDADAPLSESGAMS